MNKSSILTSHVLMATGRSFLFSDGQTATVTPTSGFVMERADHA